MNLMELHLLQSFPVTCLNRDDLGAPKTAMFGGCQRARVSSQSWKRAIRSFARKQNGEFFAGKRTRFIFKGLEKKFLENNLSSAHSRRLAIALADSLGKLDNSEKGDVKTLLYFSPLEMESMAVNMMALVPQELLQDLDNLNPEDKKSRKNLEKAERELGKLAAKAAKGLNPAVKDKADIAVFGRMVADDHSLMVEGAGLFSHALSTHSTNNDIDFFSAVDDEKMGSQDRGAGHIGTLEFNTACYYRYVGLNLDLLFDHDHLGHFTDEERKKVIEDFLKAALWAVPEARKNSMFGWNPPQFALGLKRSGQPLALFNAFEKPVRSGDGYLEPSVKQLKSHWKEMKERFCLSDGVVCQAELPPLNLDGFVDQLV